MARYLLVAHQTATSPLLLRRVQEIVRGDPEATFTVLVPETHIQHTLVCDEVETRAAAQRRAAEAHAALVAAGTRVVRTEVGSASPLAAIHDELRRHPGEHDAILLSTFAPGISRWLNIDLPSRLERDGGLPVLHVYPGGDAAWSAAQSLRRSVAGGAWRRRPSPRLGPEEAPAFASARDVLPVAALLSLHALLGGSLALQYSRTFFIAEAFVLVFMSLLVIALWRFGGVAPPGGGDASDSI
jgi:hypothetical protein